MHVVWILICQVRKLLTHSQSIEESYFCCGHSLQNCICPAPSSHFSVWKIAIPVCHQGELDQEGVGIQRGSVDRTSSDMPEFHHPCFWHFFLGLNVYKGQTKRLFWVNVRAMFSILRTSPPTPFANLWFEDIRTTMLVTLSGVAPL